jgi:hypothetical protein
MKSNRIYYFDFFLFRPPFARPVFQFIFPIFFLIILYILGWPVAVPLATPSAPISRRRLFPPLVKFGSVGWNTTSVLPVSSSGEARRETDKKKINGARIGSARTVAGSFP